MSEEQATFIDGTLAFCIRDATISASHHLVAFVAAQEEQLISLLPGRKMSRILTVKWKQTKLTDVCIHVGFCLLLAPSSFYLGVSLIHSLNSLIFKANVVHFKVRLFVLPYPPLSLLFSVSFAFSLFLISLLNFSGV